MKKQSNKNAYAKVLKDKVDQIALECGFYKESNTQRTSVTLCSRF